MAQECSADVQIDGAGDMEMLTALTYQLFEYPDGSILAVSDMNKDGVQHQIAAIKRPSRRDALLRRAGHSAEERVAQSERAMIEAGWRMARAQAGDKAAGMRVAEARIAAVAGQNHNLAAAIEDFSAHSRAYAVAYRVYEEARRDWEAALERLFDHA